jgi:hypothetical protein
MMDAKALLAPGCPAIQEAAAVQVLITYVNRLHGLPVPESDEELPEFYRLDPGLCLVRDDEEKDVYQRGQCGEDGGLKCPQKQRLSGALS